MMALNVSARKQKKSEKLDSDAAARLQRHIDSLGLKTVQEYSDWCARVGFSRNTNKTDLQRRAELRTAQKAVAELRLAQSKREQRSFLGTLHDILNGKLVESQVTSPHLKALCQTYETLRHQNFVRKSFLEIVQALGEGTDLLQTQTAIPQYGRAAGNNYLAGLLALAHHASDWIRKPADWKPASHNIDRQFQSLARHLFAQWPVPTFMDSVWFQGTTSEAQARQKWFVHLGWGENIRTAKLPISYSKRMAHHFMRAPAEFTVEDALRWGQIQALGGNARLVKAVLGTRLRTAYDHDDFWTTVIQFLIANPMLDLAQIGPIVDYLQHEKYTPQEIFVAPGQLERRPPPQQNLTMKGRSPEALLRNVESWHRKLTKSTQGPAEWAPSGIVGMQFVEGSQEGHNLKIWTITELLSSAALVVEGRQMRHCVATYARSCARGDCSIWAMELKSNEGLSKILTLEIRNSSRMLVQARGKFNALPNQKERNLLHRWATQAGLELAQWI